MKEMKNRGKKLKGIYKQAIGFWFVLMVFGIVNGIVRNYVYGPSIGNELLSHQISTFTGILLFLTGMYIWLKYTNAHYLKKDLIIIGIMWLGMTITFEFIFGHYIAGHTWSKLLADYNILEGRIWGLILLTILAGPYFIGKLLIKDGIDIKHIKASDKLLIPKTQRKNFAFIIFLNFFQSIGRLSFAVLGINGGINQFLDMPVPHMTSSIMHVMFLFLGIGGLVATYGFWRRQKWGLLAVIFVSLIAIVFDIWGVTIQTTAAMGFVVPLVSIGYIYFRKSQLLAEAN